MILKLRGEFVIERREAPRFTETPSVVMVYAWWNTRLDRDLLDGAIFGAWLGMPDSYQDPRYEQVFARKLIALLGANSADNANQLKASGILP